MLKRPVRVLAALSFATIALAPFGAHAQYTGTNGQVFFSYTTGSTYVQSIAAVNIDGSESHMVAQGSDDGTNYVKYMDAATNAAGTKVAYVDEAGAYGGSTQYSIKVANADGSSPTTIYTAPVLTSPSYIQISNLVFSSDGTKIFFIQNNNPSGSTDGIYSVATTGGSATQLVVSDSTADTTGSIAVTSTHLYFVKRVISSNSFEIDKAGTDGTSQATLYTAGVGFTNQPTIEDTAPDSSVILFMKKDTNSMDQLYSVDTATGATVTALTSVSNSNYIEHANYSPDGTKLIYSYLSYSGITQTESGAVILNANGSGTPTVVRADGASPVWSAVTLATSGTYPTPLVLGSTTFSGGNGGGPGLPDAGKPTTSLPLTLGLVGLVAAGVIETARRVRRRA